MDLFTDYAAKEKQKAENAAEHTRERKIQETILGIKKKFGKNAILKGLNLEDGPQPEREIRRLEDIRHERSL